MKKHVDTFEEFLKKKKKENGKKVDWTKRKILWLKSLDILFSDIEKWLSPHIKKGDVEILKSPITIREENIEEYETQKMQINIGNGFIYVKPLGTIVLGAYGRVDLYGTKGDRLLILETWENWKFAKRTPKLETWDWNKKNFLETIQELM